MHPVLFLDIDGVINPHNYTKYPNENKIQPIFLSLVKRNKNIRTLPPFTVDQVYHFFDHQACIYIHKLVKEFDCKIVISSSWRCVFDHTQLKAILDLKNLGFAFIDATSISSNRPQEIKEYIQKNKIQKYLVIDDFNMSLNFPNHFILCKNCFNEENYQSARKALKNQYEKE